MDDRTRDDRRQRFYALPLKYQEIADERGLEWAEGRLQAEQKLSKSFARQLGCSSMDEVDEIIKRNIERSKS